MIARYYLLYASAIADTSFNNGLLHFTHSLEHLLSTVKPDLPHGLGLATLLPVVIKKIYPLTSEILVEIYDPIVPVLKGVPGKSEIISKKVEKWLFDIGITQKLSDKGFTESDISKLAHLAMASPSSGLLISMVPIKAEQEVVERIYKNSLKRLQ